MKRTKLNAMFLYVFIVGWGLVLAHLHLKPRVTHHYTGIAVEAVNPEMTAFEDVWKMETARRFPNAVLFLTHGANFGGQWVCQDPTAVDPTAWESHLYVHDLAVKLRAKYPDRVIVLVVCNPGHLKLGVPGVYHATDDVWLMPDKQSNCLNLLHLVFPTAVGNIFEFVDD